MVEKKQKRFLAVAPFECAWREELTFREVGRVAIKAFTHIDVTVVFRKHVAKSIHLASKQHASFSENCISDGILIDSRSTGTMIWFDGEFGVRSDFHNLVLLVAGTATLMELIC
ncbi:hypothetical protein Droror1_Dr00019930 [Drosera rotundifolia]